MIPFGRLGHRFWIIAHTRTHTHKRRTGIGAHAVQAVQFTQRNGSMSMVATAPVTYRVTGIERMLGAGKLVGLAIANTEIAGLSLIIQGSES
jgi:hypothetical protein